MKWLLPLFLYCSVALGGVPPTQEQTAMIYAVAYGQFGGKLPDNPPVVHIVPKAQVCVFMQEFNECTYYGAYSKGQIYIAEELDFTKKADASVLLHEFIHYFQDMSRGESKNCQEYVRDEQEAYRIQAHVLEMSGEYYWAEDMRAIGRSMYCGEEESK